MVQNGQKFYKMAKNGHFCPSKTETSHQNDGHLMGMHA